MNKYRISYKDGTIGEVETDETKQRLEQHAHITSVELIDDLVIVGQPEPVVEVIVEPEPVVEAPVTTPISEMTIAELRAEILRIAGLIAQLQQELLAIIAAEGGQQLTLNLMLGARGEEVTLLQTWLALDTAVYPEGIVSGWFGPLTKTAVIRFQDKYYEDVLAPWNFTKGTGYVGSTTRAKLNALYGGQ